ncbi:MAG TPA: YtxH domain-containing protein [Crinalium sp.]|jgi:gas vesicle protein
MSDNRSGSGLFWGGLVLGAAVGAVTGLLLAPKSGRETRQLLRKSANALPELAEDLSSSVQFQADRLSGSALRNWDGTLVRLREAIAAGIEASQRDRQQVTPPEANPDPAPRPPVRDSSLM